MTKRISSRPATCVSIETLKAPPNRWALASWPGVWPVSKRALGLAPSKAAIEFWESGVAKAIVADDRPPAQGAIKVPWAALGRDPHRRLNRHFDWTPKGGEWTLSPAGRGGRAPACRRASVRPGRRIGARGAAGAQRFRHPGGIAGCHVDTEEDAPLLHGILEGRGSRVREAGLAEHRGDTPGRVARSLPKIRGHRASRDNR